MCRSGTSPAARVPHAVPQQYSSLTPAVEEPCKADCPCPCEVQGISRADAIHRHHRLQQQKQQQRPEQQRGGNDRQKTQQRTCGRQVWEGRREGAQGHLPAPCWRRIARCSKGRGTYVPAPDRRGVKGCDAVRIYGEGYFEGLPRLCHRVCLPIGVHDLWQGSRAALPGQVQAEACRGNHCLQAAGSGRQRAGAAAGWALVQEAVSARSAALLDRPLCTLCPVRRGRQPVRRQGARHPHLRQLASMWLLPT